MPSKFLHELESLLVKLYSLCADTIHVALTNRADDKPDAMLTVGLYRRTEFDESHITRPTEEKRRGWVVYTVICENVSVSKSGRFN